jgi:hypothetical protein
MAKSTAKKEQTDADVKKKAVKLVIVHLKKKITREYLGVNHLNEWISDMEELLEKDEFNIVGHKNEVRHYMVVPNVFADKNVSLQLVLQPAGGFRLAHRGGPNISPKAY